ncbi:MAG: NADH-quinone oxidoreductase subunit L, partial [Chloroflexi bacterium]|nr:NADH-quinone oxidoreductase subunit L [Chloroflexota bacterium]
LGVGAYGAAIFHLFTHAFFKALLFLGSGSVNHATGTFDMRYMGGLRRAMPWTYATFMIGSLSLAGVFPLAGFWSKDEILAGAWAGGGIISPLVFWMSLVAVFMTAFYMFRALFMTFHGEFRGGVEADPNPIDDHAEVHLGESPSVMRWPLVVLGVAAVIVGFLVNPLTNLGIVPIHWLSHFLGEGFVEVETESFNILVAFLSSVVAVGGIGLAYAMYYSGQLSPEKVGARFKAAYTVLINKYYLDELYENIIVSRYFYGMLARGLDWFDRAVVDRSVNVVGWLGVNIGGALRQLQTGQLQSYGAVISIGILIIFAIFLITR